MDCEKVKLEAYSRSQIQAVRVGTILPYTLGQSAGILLQVLGLLHCQREYRSIPLYIFPRLGHQPLVTEEIGLKWRYVKIEQVFDIEHMTIQNQNI